MERMLALLVGGGGSCDDGHTTEATTTTVIAVSSTSLSSPDTEHHPDGLCNFVDILKRLGSAKTSPTRPSDLNIQCALAYYAAIRQLGSWTGGAANRHTTAPDSRTRPCIP